MEILHNLQSNLLHPPVLFFLLGLLAAVLKSDLEIPPQIGKFLSLYLLFDIGIKGGEELFHSGIHSEIIKILLVCAAASFLMPFLSFLILKRKLDIYNAAAIAATYGSISAVTFVTASSFLDTHGIPFSGYMVAAMALMESPAIISGLVILNLAKRKHPKETTIDGVEQPDYKIHTSKAEIFREACLNGSVFLLMGSLVIGFICGNGGESELKPFIGDIFKGMLSLYMLDMGLAAGSKIAVLKKSGVFLSTFALSYPIVVSFIGMFLAKVLGLEAGNALLFTVLMASSSYIAVPAAMRLAVPQANMSLLLPMSLGVTFVFNVIFGIPLYNFFIEQIWGRF